MTAEPMKPAPPVTMIDLHLQPSFILVLCILTASHGFQQCKIFSGLHLNATIFHRGMIEYFNENLYF
jgi:hypothetical protein